MREFNGKNLRAAREYRLKTIENVAEGIGVSRQAISQFENGKTTPSFENQLALARLLNFPCRFFTAQSECGRPASTYFRALLTTKKLFLQRQRVFADFSTAAINVLNASALSRCRTIADAFCQYSADCNVT